MSRLLFVILSFLILSACASAPGSESVYAPSEDMREMSVERCRVLEVREIEIAGSSRESRSIFRGDAVGGALGALLGGVGGSQIGKGKGRDIATASGAVLGGLFGAGLGEAAQNRFERRAGLQYALIMSDGREIVVNQGVEGRVVPVGATCRLVRSSRGVRVLPGEHLPERVHRPRKSAFY